MREGNARILGMKGQEDCERQLREKGPRKKNGCRAGRRDAVREGIMGRMVSAS